MTRRRRDGRRTLHDWDAVTPVPEAYPDAAAEMDRRFREFAQKCEAVSGPVPAAEIHDDHTVPLGIEVEITWEVPEDMEEVA